MQLLWLVAWVTGVLSGSCKSDKCLWFVVWGLFPFDMWRGRMVEGTREKYLKSGRTFQLNVFQLELFFIQGD